MTARKEYDRAVDQYVGKRVRLRRTLLQMSQEQLAEHLGVTFQQIQKYEKGANRISASRLWNISRMLDVPVSYFFDGLDDRKAPDVEMLVSDRQTILFMAYFGKLKGEVRTALYGLVRELAGVEGS